MCPLLQEIIQRKLEVFTGAGKLWTLKDYENAANAARFELASQRAPYSDNDDTARVSQATRACSRVGHLENPRPRSSDARDRRNRDRTGPYFKQLVVVEAPGAFSSNPLPLPTVLPTPLTPPHANDDHPEPTNDNGRQKKLTPSQARRAAQDARDTRKGPDWKRTKPAGKLTDMGRAVTLITGATTRTFTLNPSPDTIARALASNHNGFASWFQKRIGRELRVEGLDLPFVFAVDVTRLGRPHLHGMIPANDDQLPAVERAVRRAGGVWRAGHAAKQVHTAIVWNTDGWTSYSSRNLAAARKVIGEGVIAGTGELRRAGRDLHERLRAAEMAGR